MLIAENLIALDLAAADKQQIIQILAEKAAKAGRINSVSKYASAVMQREFDYSTAIGFGTAISHGKSDSVIDPFLMFATLKVTNWLGQDNEPVNMIFLIGVPADAPSIIHLKILARLSRLIMHREFRAALQSAESSSSVFKLLTDFELDF
ncbi:MAG: PTS sugar transporter subunit IIA [Eubacteriales bacterium]